ncbi:MAG: flagellar biosynthesis protein FlgB [Hyphomonas sp.]
MISDLPLFQVYGAMARHAAETQKVSATNIARASEPGYKAVDVEPFTDFLARTQLSEATGGNGTSVKKIESNNPAAPNGNTVSLEQEVMRSAEAVSQHDMALTVYTKTLELMRTAIGRRG